MTELMKPKIFLNSGLLMATGCWRGCIDRATPTVIDSVARVMRNDGNRGNDAASHAVLAPLMIPTPTAKPRLTATGQPATAGGVPYLGGEVGQEKPSISRALSYL
jgi:hypothetical protein